MSIRSLIVSQKAFSFFSNAAVSSSSSSSSSAIRRFLSLSTVNDLGIPSVASTSDSLNEKSAEAPPPTVQEKRRHVLKDYKALGLLNIHDVIPKLKSALWAKFDESIEICVGTSLDPRKPNQSVKGVAFLPHGNGKKIRVAVFASGADAQAAIAAGADIVGAEDLITKIQGGEINFDRAIGDTLTQYFPLDLLCCN